MDWSNSCSKERHLVEKANIANRWTQISDSRDLLVRQMDQGVARQSQAKVPMLLADVVKQLFMHEATIGKHDHMLLRVLST